MNSATTWLVL